MDFRAIEAKAKAALGTLCDVPPTALVRDLSISQQQLVEIAKALTLDCRVLILDEPTAALTEREPIVEPAQRKPREGRFGPLFGSAVHQAIGLLLRDPALGLAEVVRRAATLVGLTEHLDEAVADVARAWHALLVSGHPIIPTCGH